MIHGVKITPLTRIPDARGRILHIMKATEQDFSSFGEVYCSTVYPGIVKGWHIHTKMTLNYIVIKGNIKLVLYDERKDSPTKGELQEIFIGDSNYIRVTIPPQVWNGFMGTGTEESFVINLSDIPHDSSEISRMDPHDNHIGYNWKTIDR